MLELDDADGVLACPAGEVYPVVAGIPRFVVDQGYAEAFGAQWNHYRLTQLDSHTGATISADRARRCLGEELWHTLDDRLVLECGCGAGRFTEVLLERGARVTSVDLSAAVDANAEAFPQGEVHRVAQADVLRLPLGPREFDVVFCLGVIQHTPSPEMAIHALYEQVAPGGWLVIDHYHHIVLTRVTQQLLRQVFVRLSPQRGLRWNRRLVAALLPLHRRLRRSERWLARISPVVTGYGSYPELDDRLRDEWAEVDTYDALTDRYKHRRSVASIRRTLETLGADQIVCRRGGNGIEARCRRPGKMLRRS